jgi:hypothetical protein
MNKEILDTYKELQDVNGMSTLFRKFDEGTWIFQFNKEGELIGQVLVSSENMELIQQAPSIKAGDGTTIQTL